MFFHTDAIGSVRMVTSAQGAVLHRYDYSPDGALLHEAGTGAPWNRRSWAGKERDVETASGATAALDYFGARSYAQQLGRFTAVDPVLVVADALGDPQRWNRYGYGMNNPLRYVDPDGQYDCGSTVSAEQCDKTAVDAFRAKAAAQIAHDPAAEAAVDALGTRGDHNGVTISAEVPDKGAAADTTPTGGGATIRIGSGLFASQNGALAIALAHEGSHVQDARVFNRTGASPTQAGAERKAYAVSAAIASGLAGVLPNSSLGRVGLFFLKDPQTQIWGPEFSPKDTAGAIGVLARRLGWDDTRPMWSRGR